MTTEQEGRIDPYDRPQCEERVLRRDTYRYTGRRGGFTMHYERGQCRRKAAPDSRYCWQHMPVRQEAVTEGKADI